MENTGALMKIVKEDIGYELTYIVVNGEPWFKGKRVASLLGYTDTDQALRKHVDDDDRKKMYELRPVETTGSENEYNNTETAVFINESGLYCLILRSHKYDAKDFQQWVTKEVLPTIRKTGSYGTAPALKPVTPKTKHNQIVMMNEAALHERVVKFISEYLPHFILVPGLGQFQKGKSYDVRTNCWRLGYRSGQPDLIIMNKHKDYNGLALEFKTPNGTGVLAEKQKAFLQDLSSNGFLTIVSDKFEDILMKLIEYNKGLMYRCEATGKWFSSRQRLEVYQRRLQSISNDDEHQDESQHSDHFLDDYIND